MRNYNEWHASHVTDEDISAPWHRFVKSQISPEDINNKTILEIGCGRGGFSNYLAHINPAPAKVVASDYSTTALDIARTKYANASPLIDWQQQNVMSLTFQDCSFDTIISCETIEHVKDPKQALLELHRVLKPGGKLFLTCPNYFNLFGIWCIYRWLIGKPFTEGGQPYVNYILFPRLYSWLITCSFSVHYFKSSEIILPARVPKHLWNEQAPFLLKPFGHRTCFVLIRK
jgi:2-polyprenyl-3-methyl-5-hydroxy-6-metoxy-1,4-benzoquinol methylase